MRKLALIVLAVLAIAGCSSSPKANFYRLDSGTASREGQPKSGYTVAVSAVTVPRAVDRPQIVIRTGADQVAIEESERWAEPVKDQIGRVIAAELSRMLDGAYVYAYAQADSVNADCKVLIDVQRFDSIPGVGATIDVLWTVRPAKGAPRTGHTQAYEGAHGKTYDALVAAHRVALAVVSREIADAVNTLR